MAHAANMKESYISMSILLGLIKHKEHNWKICSDLKVVAVLTDFQQGCTKYCCFYVNGTAEHVKHKRLARKNTVNCRPR